jgi:hypothetical protein
VWIAIKRKVTVLLLRKNCHQAHLPVDVLINFAIACFNGNFK